MSENSICILLVADEVDHVALVRRALQDAPMPLDLTVAESVSEARTSLAESTPDIVIADLFLPDGRGAELLPARRELGPFPLVVMASHGNEAAAMDAMRAGALDYVVKSEVSLADMPHIVERALREWAYLAERKHMVAELLGHRERLRTLTAELCLAEERERRRIAQGIHDTVAQNLALSRMHLDSLKERLANVPEAAGIDDVIGLIDESVREVAELTLELSPAALLESGFPAALEWLVEQVRQKHALQTVFEREGDGLPLGEDLRVALFRSVRELLINVVKHARASSARVTLRQTDTETRVQVADDGLGFHPPKTGWISGQGGGFGLFSIAEQLHSLAGHMQIDSAPGSGTTVTLVAPLGGGQVAVPRQGQGDRSQ